MEENLKEQPQSRLNQNSIVNEIVNMGEETIGFEGSLLGKFKDVKSLAEAYSNLQAEFTRKSQKLSQLEKRDNLLTEQTKSLQDTESGNLANEVAVNSAKKENIVLNKENNFTFDSAMQNFENAEMKSNINDESVKSEEKVENVNKPLYLSDDWSAAVTKFFETNEKAYKFSKEIAKEILSDKALANNPSSLEIAYMRVLEKNYVNKDDLLMNEHFVDELVLKNEKIVQKIIQNYLKAIKEKSSPTLITGKKVSGVGLTPQDKPKNLEEAKKLMELIFK